MGPHRGMEGPWCFQPHDCGVGTSSMKTRHKELMGNRKAGFGQSSEIHMIPRHLTIVRTTLIGQFVYT